MRLGKYNPKLGSRSIHEKALDWGLPGLLKAVKVYSGKTTSGCPVGCQEGAEDGTAVTLGSEELGAGDSNVVVGDGLEVGVIIVALVGAGEGGVVNGINDEEALLGLSVVELLPETSVALTTTGTIDVLLLVVLVSSTETAMMELLFPGATAVPLVTLVTLLCVKEDPVEDPVSDASRSNKS